MNRPAAFPKMPSFPLRDRLAKPHLPCPSRLMTSGSLPLRPRPPTSPPSAPGQANGLPWAPACPPGPAGALSAVSGGACSSSSDNDICCRVPDIELSHSEHRASSWQEQPLGFNTLGAGTGREGNAKAEAAARQLPPPPPFVQKCVFVCQSNRLFSPSSQANCFCSCKIRD